MKTKLLLAFLVIFTFLWPPIYSIVLDRDLRGLFNGGVPMEDFELQLLLGAQRWEIEIPENKNGWVLSLETESNGTIQTNGGTFVTGGQTIVLLTRRNLDNKRIEYAWYEIESKRSTGISGSVNRTNKYHVSGFGIVDDPLADAGVTVGRPDGIVKIGEPIYRGGKTEVAGFPTPEKAEYEVRVVVKARG